MKNCWILRVSLFYAISSFSIRNAGEQDGEVLPMGTSVDILSTQASDLTADELNTPIWEKYDPLLHGNSRSKS